MRILITEPERYSDEALAIYHSCGEVRLGLPEGRDLPEVAGEADVLVIRLRHRIDRNVLDAAPDLQAVVTPTTGLDHLDVGALEERGIQIISLKGETEFLRSIPATAELTWGLLLAVQRKITAAAASVLGGDWERDRFRGRDLRGRVLGILGYGRIGSMVADFGKAFGMEVLAYDIRPAKQEGVRFVPLDELYRSVDVLSVHLPMEACTQGFIDERALQGLKPGVVLLNTSRGGIIDEDALLEALRSGRIGGVGLDVLGGETVFRGRVPAGNRLCDYAATHDNLVITPHIGGASQDSMEATEIFCAQRFAHFYSERRTAS